MNFTELVEKYNVPAPRYTSYPTVPFWENEQLGQDQWLDAAKKSFIESNDAKGISLYFHLPFCESLCTYCGCNKRITKNHGVEGGYIDALLAEWQLYLDHFEGVPNIREIHLGGGTPTFFSAENLDRLISGIFKNSKIAPSHEFGFEGHPNNVTNAHLKTLFDLGFRRMSLGVQDFHEKVQRAINRIQPYENVKRSTLMARETGFSSLNFDLIYGLPFQTLDIIKDTIDKVAELMPDRIAFYSYAHVPWKAPSQRGYSEADLPESSMKRMLYETGKQMLLQLGYKDVGMDHFALPDDELFKAKANKTLHRNFMGYTPYPTDLLLGLGCSSISDSGYAYAQNLKVVEDYKEKVLNGKLAVFKGHIMTEEDMNFKQLILDLSCRGEAIINDYVKSSLQEQGIIDLKEMEKEGLLNLSEEKLTVTEIGFAFIRNICMVFDMRLRNSKAVTRDRMFSKSI
jgi:oxygen-independent coproporphyrinogen III oxidase